MNGITVTMPAGGAERESRARRLMKEATIAEGRCLFICQYAAHPEKSTNEEPMKISRSRKKRGRYLTCRTSRSRRE